MMDALTFVFAAETATKTQKAGLGGYLAGIAIADASGAITLTVKILSAGTEVTAYSKATPVNGIFQPVTRMDDTAGADLAGAGEYIRFIVPPGATIEVESSGNWTGNVRVIIDK